MSGPLMGHKLRRMARAISPDLEELFERELPYPVSADNRAAEVAAATFALEGAITHPIDSPTTKALCEDNLVDSASNSTMASAPTPVSCEINPG